MPSPEHIRQVIGEWIEKAEHNLKAAYYLLDHGEDYLADMVCFHAQQVVEMYLKAVLVQAGIPVPKIHDIDKIIALIPSVLYRGFICRLIFTLWKRSSPSATR
jgi:HEPN domain-containing protein